MSKVKLTRKQAKELEYYKLRGEEQIDYLVNVHHNKLRPDLEISKLTTSEIAKALYIGYEIKEGFAVGDWVVDNLGRVLQVTDVYFKNGIEIVDAIDDGVCTYRLGAEFVRHATPEEIAEEKERRWWAKHNRMPWELKEFDELRDKRNDNRYTASEIADDINAKLYDTYSNPTYFNQEDIKENFLVVCFAEDRLD